MAENYVVNYSINVQAEAATQALASFQSAAASLTAAADALKTFEASVKSVMASFQKLSGKQLTIKVNVGEANKKLDKVISKLNTIKKLAAEGIVINTVVNTAGAANVSASAVATGNAVVGGATTTAAASSGRKNKTSLPARLPKQQSSALQRCQSTSLVPINHLIIETYPTVYSKANARFRNGRLPRGFEIQEGRSLRRGLPYRPLGLPSPYPNTISPDKLRDMVFGKNRYVSPTSKFSNLRDYSPFNIGGPLPNLSRAALRREVFGTGRIALPAPQPIPQPIPQPAGNETGKNKTGKNLARKRFGVQKQPSLGALSYKALGPAMIDSGGIGAFSMLKGMGIAYGITGLGTAISSIIKDSAEYNNIITTTRNILKTHDPDRESFDERFSAMERIIRNVGIETKFTAPEVADASRFLAMAGFDVSAISKSIRPIADIALVGDSNLGETADVVTNIMTGYDIDPGSVRHAADVMTNTFTMSNTTLMEIAESYKYAASLLSASGVSFEEATAGIGILGNAGIKGSQAGTTMRTIMANIVNPTKKQGKVWEEIGVKRYDENGNIRDLVDIFSDLNRKGLSVDKVYRMFNRTAAQGAVALIKNVDEWNNIVKENFLSAGVTEELANAKKNTIQGLWAQLTSMFTEDGLRAFEGLDGQIRQMLQKTIDWLKTPEAGEVIAQVGHMFIDLVNTLKDFTSIIIGIYRRFGPFLGVWLKLQMYLSAILVPLRTFRALLNFASFSKAAIRSIGALTVSMNGFATSVRGALTQLTGFNLIKKPLASGLGMMTRFDAINSRFGEGLTGRIYAPEPVRKSLAASIPVEQRSLVPFGVQNNWQTPMATFGLSEKLQNKPTAVIERYTRMQKFKANRVIGEYGGGAGAIAGSMLGGYAGSYLGEPGSFGSVLGSVGGVLVGGGLGAAVGSTVTPWMSTTALPFLMGNPTGWAIAATLAISALTAAVVSWAAEAVKATKSTQEFFSSIASNYGINYSDRATEADKYLSLVYDKQKSVNQIMLDHIMLIKEQLGLMSDADKKLSDKTFGETHPAEIEKLSDAFGFWNVESKKKQVALDPIRDANGKIDSDFNVAMYRNSEGSGYAFQGVHYPGLGKNYEVLATARMLYGLGKDSSEGSELQSIRKNLNAHFLMSTTLKDFNAVTTQVNEARKKKWIPESTTWDPEDLKNKPESEWKQSYFYVKGFNDTLTKWYDYSNPQNSANAQMLADFVEILKQFSKGNISEETESKFLLHSGIPIFDSSKFGEFGSDAFMRKMGWINGEWQATSYKIFDPQTGQERTLKLTSEQSRQAFLDFHQKIIEIVNSLNPKLRPYFESFVNNPIWGYGGTDNGSNGEATLDGVNYKWDPKTKTWNPDRKILPALDNNTMQKRLKSTAGQATNVTETSTINTGHGRKIIGGGGGPSASDYKNHYSKTSAAPKQVIVRIGNLMNVDKVDLSNPDKAAVVASLKSELAQALVDVVHDFDETWNG